MDPDEGLHLEIQDPGVVEALLPHTPKDLINMQASSASPSRPDKPIKNDKTTLKTKQALDFLEKRAVASRKTSRWLFPFFATSSRITMMRWGELIESTDGKRSQVSAWAVDADQLMLAGFLEGIEL